MLPKLSDLRFYLYISTAKIDMLYEQLVDTPARTKRGLSIPTPIGSLTLETAPEEKITREKKRRAVEAELEQQQLIGTLEAPKEYFKGMMSMRWGLFDDNGTRPDNEPPLVYFGGFDKAVPLVVGLGGSSRHVVGCEGMSSTHSRSYASLILRWLMAGLEQDSRPQLPDWWDMPQEEQAVFNAMAVALKGLRPPTQELVFLAKTLTYGTLHGYEHMTGVPSARALLGTPIYVAQAHPLPDHDYWGLDAEWDSQRKLASPAKVPQLSPGEDDDHAAVKVDSEPVTSQPGQEPSDE